MGKEHLKIPPGMMEVTDDYQLNLIHYELMNLKPRGTIQFEWEDHGRKFVFFTELKRETGIFARFADLKEPGTLTLIRHIQLYAKTPVLVTIPLLQFQIAFITDALELLPSAPDQSHRTLRIPFPTKIHRIHRRKFIRIPFNDSFPAELSFVTPLGEQVSRKLMDLSREGMRVKIHADDLSWVKEGVLFKQSVLKVIGRELPMGVRVMNVMPQSGSVGLKIVMMSEDHQAFLKDCIRILMQQILKLPDPGDSDP